MQFLSIPDPILEILHTLEAAGFAAYLVGGCVRDGLLGRIPNDWDICTAAPPEKMLRLFSDARATGLQHGTVTVLCGGLSAEVTTFRAEGAYTDHRHPDGVQFVSDVEADLARRDFTINAMARTAGGSLTDPFGGQVDLQAGIIRAVGVPKLRFQEDALRMLRAYRFAAQLGFCLESETHAAILRCAPLAETLAAERVRDELERILCAPHPELLGDAHRAGLLERYFTSAMDVRWDMLRTVPPELRPRRAALALLLADAGLPDPLKTFSALRMDRAAQTDCAAVLALYRSGAAERNVLFWKAAIAEHGTQRAALTAAVFTALYGGGDAILLQGILQSGDCCTLRQLAVSGSELIRLGLRGRAVGSALHALLRYVWAHPEQNEAAVLIPLLRKGEISIDGFLE